MKKLLKTSKYTILSLAISVLFSSSVFAAPDLKLAVVDVIKVQQKFVDEIKTKLEEEFKGEKSDLERQIGEFRKDVTQFQTDSKTMSESGAKSKAEELGKKEIELQQKKQVFEQKVSLRQQQELQTRLEKLYKVVQDISKKDNYDMVLSSAAALYLSDKYDITNKVVDGYNKAKN